MPVFAARRVSLILVDPELNERIGECLETCRENQGTFKDTAYGELTIRRTSCARVSTSSIDTESDLAKLVRLTNRASRAETELFVDEYRSGVNNLLPVQQPSWPPIPNMSHWLCVHSNHEPFVIARLQ